MLDPLVALLLLAADEQTMQLNFVPTAHIEKVTVATLFRSAGPGG